MGRVPRTIVGGLTAALLLVSLHVKAEVDPILNVAPSAIVFDSVAAGGIVTGSMLVNNSGTNTATITNVFPISGNAELTASPTSFSLPVGQSQVVTFSYAPASAGDLSDAFRIESDALVFGSTAPSLSIPVRGIATGPRITLSHDRLSFGSLNIGSAVADTLIVGNAGNAELRVLSFLTTEADFSVGASSFVLAPDDTQSVIVTYTPTTAAAVSDTMTILSNSPDGSLSFVGLGGLETPTQSSTARISLLQTSGSASPAAGDSVRIALFLVPNADTLRGVEAFIGFDNTLLDPVGDEGPFLKQGIAERTDFQINRVEATTPADASAHFSTFFLQNRRHSDTLTVLVFEVLADIRAETVIRVLTEDPKRNSNFLTPENFLFTIPGSTEITLGNQLPMLRPFSVLSFDEDIELAIDLTVQASDRETGSKNLSWQFLDTSGLFTIVVEEADTVKTARVTPPVNGFGVFDLLAIVTDEGGASDSAVVILDVHPTNDPPDTPVYSTPANNSVDEDRPVRLRWAGGDPEGDAVTYEVRIGTALDGLQPAASDLAVAEYEAATLGASTTYFWQIVTIDASGARAEGEIRWFTTGPDVTPPAFVSGPRDTSVTPTSAMVVWDTDETATSVVRVGLRVDLSDSTDLGTAGDNVFLLLHHEVQLSDLAPETTYFYQSWSRDLFGNIGLSPIGSFTTLEPEFNPGDFDGNLTIDFIDFLAFSGAYNTSVGHQNYNLIGDLDGNNTIDFSDFLAFAAIFGSSV